jgi:predicted nucleotidyltransferase
VSSDGVPVQHKQKILSLIEALLPQVRVYLYGSRARGTFTQGSDIDLALKGGDPLDFMLVGEVKSVLEGTNLPYSFDVVDVHAVSPELRAEIERTGVLWSK